MNKFTLLFLLLLCLSANSFSQTTFQTLYGSTDLYAKLEIASIKPTSDGGAIATGFTFNYGVNGKVFLLKTNADGSLNWFKVYYAAKKAAISDTTQDTYPTNAFAVQQTADGGYILAGRAFVIPDGGLQDAYVLKTDSEGNVLWQRMYGDSGDEQANSIIQTSTGDYVIAGYHYVYNKDGIPFSSSVYAVKLSTDGNILWSQTYQTDASKMEEAVSVVETEDNNFVLSGTSTTKFTATRAVLLMKIEAATGSVLWSKTYGSASAYLTSSDLKAATDGSLVVSGTTGISYETESDAFIMKVDANGNAVQWAKSIATADSSFSETANSLLVSSDGGFALYGSINYYPSDKQYLFLAKTDGGGNVSWSNQYGGGGGYGTGKAIAQTGDGGYLLGSFQNIGFGFEGSTGQVVKTDSAGHAGCYETSLTASATDLSDIVINEGPVPVGTLDSIHQTFIVSSSPYFPMTVLCQNPSPDLVFTQFTAKNTGGKNVLNWKTEKELKSDYYEVQKTKDKKTFSVIGRVNATYKTFSTKPYSFTDNSSVQGTTFYRIKAVRNNKRVFYSAVATVKTATVDLITVSTTTQPGLLLVNSKDAIETPYVEYAVFNSVGSKVYTGKLQSYGKFVNTPLALSSLPTGIYFISFNTKEGVVSQKFIIAR